MSRRTVAAGSSLAAARKRSERAPTPYARIMAAHRKVVKLTARMIPPGRARQWTEYDELARQRAEAQREFETLLKAAVDGEGARVSELEAELRRLERIAGR